MNQPTIPPITGLEPPWVPLATLFMRLEEAAGRGQWLYYRLMQILLAAQRFGGTGNEEGLRQIQLMAQSLTQPVTATQDPALAALRDYVATVLDLWRGSVRMWEAMRHRNEAGVHAAAEEGVAAANAAKKHLARARAVLEPWAGNLPWNHPHRPIPAYVDVLDLELDNLLQVIEMQRMTATSKDVTRYLEMATRAASIHRGIARRIAALGISDPGVAEFAYNLDRSADMVVEQASAVERMTKGDLEYMPLQGDRVFVIHGHSPDYEDARRMLEGMGFEGRVTVLKEEPSRGRTIHRKFLDHAGQACMALALVTPDDLVTKEANRYGQARPNVLFEIGWFAGRFGQDKVCILVRGDTPLPSDLNGIVVLVYEQDVAEVERDLRKEIQALGLLPEG